MEKHGYGFLLAFSIVISLGLASFISCIVAEVKRAKWKDVRLVGKLCYLPGNSSAYGFGVAALICLSIAQILGNWVICSSRCYYSREKGTGTTTTTTTITPTSSSSSSGRVKRPAYTYTYTSRTLLTLSW